MAHKRTHEQHLLGSRRNNDDRESARRFDRTRQRPQPTTEDAPCRLCRSCPSPADRPSRRAPRDPITFERTQQRRNEAHQRRSYTTEERRVRAPECAKQQQHPKNLHSRDRNVDRTVQSQNTRHTPSHEPSNIIDESVHVWNLRLVRATIRTLLAKTSRTGFCSQNTKTNAQWGQCC